MSRNTRRSRPTRIFQKFFVSAFVIVTFIAYALHERSLPADEASHVVVPTPITLPTQDFQESVTVTPVPPSTALDYERRSGQAPPPPTESDADIPTVTRQASAPRPTATRRVLPTPTDVPQPTQQVFGQYRDGTFTGNEADAFYGIVQVQAVIQNGKLADVEFLQYPSDRRTSQRINSYAVPYLQQEALQTQNAQVDIISGATLTSEAFIQSLESALSAAKNGS